MLHYPSNRYHGFTLGLLSLPLTLGFLSFTFPLLASLLALHFQSLSSTQLLFEPWFTLSNRSHPFRLRLHSLLGLSIVWLLLSSWSYAWGFKSFYSWLHLSSIMVLAVLPYSLLVAILSHPPEAPKGLRIQLVKGSITAYFMFVLASTSFPMLMKLAW